VAGLSNDFSSATDNSMPFAFNIWDFGLWEVREDNDWKTDGTYALGDTFRIEVGTSGTVRYYHNGTLVYTSSTSAAVPLVFDATLMPSGTTLSGAVIKR
jgi:hypothetical protein